MRIISYNLRKHRASGELRYLVEAYSPDILCLQECNAASLPDRIHTLQLADSTKFNRLGLAIYGDQERFNILRTQAFQLDKSLHDRVLTPARERLVGARLVDRHEDRELTVASFHAAPLTGLNSLRRRQISSAHARLYSLGKNIPIMMAGDYNYPLFQRNLATHIGEAGYELARSEQRTYTRYRVFRGHFDFVTFTGFAVDRVETLPGGDSDHRPILIHADYREV